MTTTAPSISESRADGHTVNRLLIRGTCNVSDLKPVVYLIKALCPESGHVGEFRDWDRVYSAPADVKAPKNSIRLRKSLLPSSVSKEGACSLMYFGIADRRVPQPLEKRTITTVAIGGKDSDSLLNVLGCTFAFEYVRKGVRHRTRDGVVVDVYMVDRLRKSGDPTSAAPFIEGDDQHGVVEIVSDNGANSELLLTLMHHLAPFVNVRAYVRQRQ